MAGPGRLPQNSISGFWQGLAATRLDLLVEQRQVGRLDHTGRFAMAEPCDRGHGSKYMASTSKAVGIQSFDEFLDETSSARYEAFLGRPYVQVESPEAFEDQK